MTLEEVVRAKQELSNNIANLCEEFSRKYNIDISNIVLYQPSKYMSYDISVEKKYEASITLSI